MNVKFNYLYRDAGNYKSWGLVIFRNPEELSINEIEQRLRQSFFQHDLFIAGQIGIPEVFLYGAADATEDDISFHEFDSVELTDDTSNDQGNRTIRDFLHVVELSGRLGWKTFTPQVPQRH